MGTPDLPQRGALSLRAPGLSWVRERGLTADLGAGRRRRGNRLQNAFRPGGGGAGSPEPRSRWVCVCPELVGGGCPRRCYFHPLWLQQRAGKGSVRWGQKEVLWGREVTSAGTGAGTLEVTPQDGYPKPGEARDVWGCRALSQGSPANPFSSLFLVDILQFI